MKLLLELSYCGSAYHGWQVQGDAPTVQKTLQDACETLFGQRPPVTGCSRTDSGVHAKQFFCTAEGKFSVPTDRVPAALNALLPEDIAVLSAREVSPDFHARYSCTGKEYLYDICVCRHRDPLTVGRAWQYCRPLDVAAMNEGAGYLCGKQDFASFCAAGSSVSDTVRTVRSLAIEQKGEHLLVRISADGFLYNMVRIIVGTLVEVGRGAMPPEQVEQILRAADRSTAGPTAPACGLYLNQVFYS